MNGGKFVNCGEFMDEKMIWIASRTFTDEHSGKALTDAEMAEREEWEKEYSHEIWKVSEILKDSETFNNLDFSRKVALAYSLIKQQIRENRKKLLEIQESNKITYIDIKDENRSKRK